MPLDPSIVSNAFANVSQNMPDINSFVNQRVQGAENIYNIERQRKADALVMEDRAAAAAQAQEEATVKALLPAFTYVFKTGDLAGGLDRAPAQYQDVLIPHMKALEGRSLEEIQAALIGSLSASPSGQEALAAIQRGETFGVQSRQQTLAEQRFAAEQKTAADEAASGRKAAFTKEDAQGNIHFFDVYGNELRVAKGAGKPAPAVANAPGDKQQARQGVDGTLSRILDEYKVLKEEKEIVSTENTTMENIAARVKTKLGPYVGRTVGTKAQSARDTIANLRQALLTDIKAATGMSSKAIDSNVELTSFLDSLGDPNQSLQTIQKTLAELSVKYGMGSLSVNGAEAPPVAAPVALPEGATTTNW